MANVLEPIFAAGMLSVVGTPDFIGLGIMTLFTLAVLMVPTSPALKAMGIFAGCFLAVPYIGIAAVIITFFGGAILYLAIMQIYNR